MRTQRTVFILSLTCLVAVALLSASLAHAQFRYPPPYGYGYAAADSSLRIRVTPKEAGVYVDGYYAGTVDDFDGVFQRLHVTPGQHELSVYLEGYRTLSQKLYLAPNATRKITATLERLGAGETSDRAPAPLGPPQPPQAAGGSPFPRRGPAGVPPEGVPPDRRPPERQPPPPSPAEQSPTQGTVAVRVQPSGSDIVIDGERWAGPEGDERLVIQLADGVHTVEVHKDGYRTYRTDITIRRGETTPLSVSLTKQ